MPVLVQIDPSDVVELLKASGWTTLLEKNERIVLQHESLPAPVLVPLHSPLTVSQVAAILVGAGFSPESAEETASDLAFDPQDE